MASYSTIQFIFLKKNCLALNQLELWILLYIYCVSSIIYIGNYGLSGVWNKKESRFKKDFGHSQNLS